MLDDLKKELEKYGKISGKRGLTPGFSGNISVRSSDNIIITASGSANGFLDKDDLLVIDFWGNILEGNKKPSTEYKLHLEFYKKRSDINSVFHFHPPYLTSFAACHKNIDEKVLAEIVYCFGEIPCADYAIPGSEKLVENTSIYFDKYDVVLMANHGVIVGGKDIKDAFLKMELCENYAKTLFFTKFLDGAKMLNEKDVLDIYNLRG